MNIIQVDLHRELPQNTGIAKMTTWVENRPDLKVGVVINLKDKIGDWTVDRVYDNAHSASEFDWHRKWDNNI